LPPAFPEPYRLDSGPEKGDLAVDMSHAIVWSREALRMSLLLGGPLLAAAFLVGLLVNIGQTLTQLHEPVVGLIPRIAAVTVVLLLILPWLLTRWVSFAVELIESIPSLL
jgi:flagellar biosynthetic protein FliQ